MSSIRLRTPKTLPMESDGENRQKLVQSLSVVLSLGGENDRNMATRRRVKGKNIVFHGINKKICHVTYNSHFDE